MPHVTNGGRVMRACHVSSRKAREPRVNREAREPRVTTGCCGGGYLGMARSTSYICHAFVNGTDTCSSNMYARSA